MPLVWRKSLWIVQCLFWDWHDSGYGILGFVLPRSAEAAIGMPTGGGLFGEASGRDESSGIPVELWIRRGEILITPSDLFRDDVRHGVLRCCGKIPLEKVGLGIVGTMQRGGFARRRTLRLGRTDIAREVARW